MKQTRGWPISVARYHVNFHALTLHDKLEIVFVRCTADFMTRRQNLHFKIFSQHKLKNDNEYIPKSSQINLELDFEKVTKEGGGFPSPHREALTSHLWVSFETYVPCHWGRGPQPGQNNSCQHIPRGISLGYFRRIIDVLWKKTLTTICAWSTS